MPLLTLLFNVILMTVRYILHRPKRLVWRCYIVISPKYVQQCYLDSRPPRVLLIYMRAKFISSLYISKHSKIFGKILLVVFQTF